VSIVRARSGSAPVGRDGYQTARLGEIHTRPLVDWVASALIAQWRRQEVEGRYRGADDFRALHIDPNDALASWRAATSPPVPWPPALGDAFAALIRQWGLAQRLGLDAADRLVAAVAVAVELEPRLRPLVSALTDDPATRQPTVALVVELAEGAGVTTGTVRRAVHPTGRLATLDLARAIAVDGRPSGLDSQLVASDWLVDRMLDQPELPLPGVHRCRVARRRGAGQRPPGPVAVTGADHLRHGEYLAGVTGCGAVVVVDPAAVAPEPVARAARSARIDGAILVLACDQLPEPWLVELAERVAGLGVLVAVSLAPLLRWLPPPGWRTATVSPLTATERLRRWQDRLRATRLTVDAEDVLDVARQYRLGAGGIDDAVACLAGQAFPSRPAGPRLGREALHRAARTSGWRDLSAVARPGPTGVGWADLVVPDQTRRQLGGIAAAIQRRRLVLDDWGFADRPGGRGYHLLFAGPSGTGKTLSAAVVAEAVGLDLWVVDLARVVDKYLGETEKQLDRLLAAAQVSSAMLLFDEADALFGRRGEVREARDRWANVEVAYLLQRIEDHDGVTVLTTNVSHHLDGAFARRMSQRVEFPMPDARLRRQLWHQSVPTTAPMLDRSDLDTVADRFELAGGAIRTAAVNAAFAAASDGGRITLAHVVRASVGELTKAGRAPTRDELGDLLGLLDEAGP
jgi:hypothetical protein